MRSTRVSKVARLLYKPPRKVPSDFQPTYNFADAGMVKRAIEEAAISVDAINIKHDPITAGAKKIPKGVKETGAWRYPGGVIQRHADRWINGKEYFDPKDPDENRRRIESNFFITLNTNRTMKGERFVFAKGQGRQTQSTGISGGTAAVAKEVCKEAVDYLSKDAVICQYLKFGPKSPAYEEDRYHDVISKIEWQAAVETGENQERLHCHIWMTVHHYSQVQINMPVIQNLFKKYYNDKVSARLPTEASNKVRINGRPYVNVKLLPTSDWAVVMKQYIHKGMAGGSVTSSDA